MSGAPPPTPAALVRDAGVVLGVFLLAGTAVGLVWPQLVDPAVVVLTPEGLSTGEVALSRRFDADGWFSVLGGGAGLVLGTVLQAWRRTDALVTVLVLAAGALLAAAWAAQLGTWVGPDDPQQVLAGAQVGDEAPGQVRVDAAAAYLAWPVGALVGALVVLWSSPAERRTGVVE